MLLYFVLLVPFLFVFSFFFIASPTLRPLRSMPFYFVSIQFGVLLLLPRTGDVLFGLMDDMVSLCFVSFFDVFFSALFCVGIKNNDNNANNSKTQPTNIYFNNYSRILTWFGVVNGFLGPNFSHRNLFSTVVWIFLGSACAPYAQHCIGSVFHIFSVSPEHIYHLPFEYYWFARAKHERAIVPGIFPFFEDGEKKRCWGWWWCVSLHSIPYRLNVIVISTISDTHYFYALAFLLLPNKFCFASCLFFFSSRNIRIASNSNSVSHKESFDFSCWIG